MNVKFIIRYSTNTLFCIYGVKVYFIVEGICTAVKTLLHIKNAKSNLIYS